MQIVACVITCRMGVVDVDVFDVCVSTAHAVVHIWRRLGRLHLFASPLVAATFVVASARAASVRFVQQRGIFCVDLLICGRLVLQRHRDRWHILVSGRNARASADLPVAAWANNYL